MRSYVTRKSPAGAGQRKKLIVAGFKETALIEDEIIVELRHARRGLDKFAEGGVGLVELFEGVEFVAVTVEELAGRNRDVLGDDFCG